ncbi:MAG: DAHL domain-containing protein, partial [Polyangiales bacterium]
MLGALRIAWVVLGLGAISALGVAVSTNVDGRRHDEYSDHTRSVRELDARLNEEVAKSRLGIVTHYDDLVRTDDRLRFVQRELGEIPDYVAEEDRRTIARRLERFAGTLDDKRDLVESFKTEQAILRNSLRAFPRGADRLLDRVEDTPDTGALHDALEKLRHDVMRLALAPSRELALQTRCDLRALGDDAQDGRGQSCSAERVEVPASLSPALDTVLSHARIIIERRKSTEDLVAEIMTLPGSERSRAVADAYDDAYRAAEESSRARWAVFLALGAALLM